MANGPKGYPKPVKGAIPYWGFDRGPDESPFKTIRPLPGKKPAGTTDTNDG